MRALVVGSGMYVTGRGGTGVGTILAALCQYSRVGELTEIVVVSRSEASASAVTESLQRINQALGSGLKATFRAIEGTFDELSALNAEFGFDAAIVSIPDHLHFGYAEKLIRLGIPSLVVKPLVPTLEEHKRLIALSQNNNVYCAVEFHKRFDETNLLIKRELTRGNLGAVKYVQVDYSQRISIPTETFKDWSYTSNIFQYLGVHYVDLINFLTGCAAVRVLATGTRGTLSQRGIDTFDSVHTVIQWRGEMAGMPQDFLSIHNTNWIDPNCSSALSDQAYKVVGDNGRIDCDQKNRGLQYTRPSMGFSHPNPYFSDFLPNPSGDLQFSGYGYSSIRLFLDDVTGLRNDRVLLDDLRRTRPSFENTIVSTQVVEAANHSLNGTQTWVDIA